MRNLRSLPPRLAVCLTTLALTLTLAAGARAADNPNYQSQTQVLKIPRVDTPEQVGRFQDAVLQPDGQGGWTLKSLETLGQGIVYNVFGATSVEVLKTSTPPVAVYLRVSGSDTACDYAGPQRIHQRMVGSRFDVNISVAHMNPSTTLHVCTANVRPYRITVPLEVYGLPAGTYTYNINSVRTGSFTLDGPNQFADDCEVTRYGNCP